MANLKNVLPTNVTQIWHARGCNRARAMRNLTCMETGRHRARRAGVLYGALRSVCCVWCDARGVR
eukprot:11214379-Lingulodinium_polyedra.AAC.1